MHRIVGDTLQGWIHSTRYRFDKERNHILLPRVSRTIPIFGISIAALTVAVIQTRAQVQVVYDNGGFALMGAAGITASISADDFSLTSTRLFSAIRFWAVDSAPGLTPNFSGTLTWAVRGNDNGIPGAARGGFASYEWG